MRIVDIMKQRVATIGITTIIKSHTIFFIVLCLLLFLPVFALL